MTAKKEPSSINLRRSQEAASPSPGTQTDRLPPSYDALFAEKFPPQACGLSCVCFDDDVERIGMAKVPFNVLNH